AIAQDKPMKRLRWVVFSRNRPYQLAAFLRSAALIGRVDLTSVAVLHRYDEPFLPGLRTVEAEHPEALYIAQTSWLDSLGHALSLCGETMSFATDDSIFVRPCHWEVGEQVLLKNDLVLAFCHRYGLHLSYCYVQDRPVSPPDGFVRDGTFFWR